MIPNRNVNRKTTAILARSSFLRSSGYMNSTVIEPLLYSSIIYLANSTDAKMVNVMDVKVLIKAKIES
ncbi:hypothetical protein D3C73_1539130 [compost metagenome]